MAWDIALVGIGKIARDQHIPAIAGNPDFTLAATSSRNATVDGAEAFKSLPELLEARPDISCISLCTPPQVRYADARAALEAGRHVMLEKPPGATLSEVHDLQALAEAKGVSLYATWHSRHAAAVELARNWLADKAIRKVEVIWKEDVRRWHPGQEWIWEPGGLGVFDPGINGLSVLTAIYPRPIHLTDASLTFPENRQTPIAADLTFRDPAGAEMSAVFDWRQEGEQTWAIHVTTDEGEAKLTEGGARFFVGDEEQPTGETASAALGGEYPSLYARFAELVPGSTIDVDLSPMTHVSDAFTLGRRLTTDPFEF
ncbi:Gfo/Idh/MocA family protein [Pelagovum pacificum]|uniref:Gfo/Idh/MocA family oxidoreductase n=1 Tax=Pelagovum pacificum TaxID=2588711 RepID=A0A5C5GH94_9RHOB|nr:Gfo/Idh/MocA family oxidoreductase [Pelagovum pacificum]QQA43405.1 Gfo/Idh/MocA family oxidoreductase [Pelagovum pacificum]TNY33457.1 Gfo/Idh/MocA family oxidoreductase [Pelagovum pacificum]